VLHSEVLSDAPCTDYIARAPVLQRAVTPMAGPRVRKLQHPKHVLDTPLSPPNLGAKLKRSHMLMLTRHTPSFSLIVLQI